MKNKNLEDELNKHEGNLEDELDRHPKSKLEDNLNKHPKKKREKKYINVHGEVLAIKDYEVLEIIEQNNAYPLYEIEDKKVKKLNLNGINKLPIEIFDLDQLAILDLNLCELKKIPKEIYKAKNLKELYLSFNKLKNLPKEVLQLNNLEYVEISYNPLTSTNVINKLEDKGVRIKWEDREDFEDIDNLKNNAEYNKKWEEAHKYFNLGKDLSSSHGSKDRELDYYDKAISICKDHVGANYRKGWALIGANRPEEAIRKFEENKILFSNSKSLIEDSEHGIEVAKRQIKTNQKFRGY